MHVENCYVTLTYNDKYLPSDGSLDKTHFQLFMKKLRKKYPDRSIRYYHCGEYGEDLGRPHYHACLFNIDFDDKKYLFTQNGHKIYTSPKLEKIWGKGFVQIGNVTFKSAGYVARYILKKINGEDASEHYLTLDAETGELKNLQAEYTTMSLKPGIGATWLEKYWTDVFPSDEVIINGRPMKPPSFYLRQLQKMNPDGFNELKEKRKKELQKMQPDLTPERLKVREIVTEKRLERLIRPLERK